MDTSCVNVLSALMHCIVFQSSELMINLSADRQLQQRGRSLYRSISVYLTSDMIRVNNDVWEQMPSDLILREIKQAGACYDNFVSRI